VDTRQVTTQAECPRQAMAARAFPTSPESRCGPGLIPAKGFYAIPIGPNLGWPTRRSSTERVHPRRRSVRTLLLSSTERNLTGRGEFGTQTRCCGSVDEHALRMRDRWRHPLNLRTAYLRRTMRRRPSLRVTNPARSHFTCWIRTGKQPA